MAGGYNSHGYVTIAHLYDPSTGVWTTAGSLTTGRISHTATLLPNGKVLVAGGMNTSTVLNSTELYDPDSGWTATIVLNTARRLHTATLLTNGKVLVAGGSDDTSLNPNGINSAELYDPATGFWTNTTSLATGREEHTATLLANGKVLVAGGYDKTDGYLTSAELYNPATGGWSSAGTLTAFFSRLGHTATLMPNGQVLLAGGDSLATAELYNPASNSWSDTGAPPLAAGATRPPCCPTARSWWPEAITPLPWTVPNSTGCPLSPPPAPTPLTPPGIIIPPPC